MGMRNGETAEEYLERIPSFAREKSALPRVREFLGLLGNPDRDFSVIHVAGTNGKGSVCAMTSAILREAGISCGVFVSPHLVEIRERFLINGEMVSEEEFLAAFEPVLAAVGTWTEMGNPHPTYFEFLFYMGLVLFRRAGVQVLILETGMGGRFDVTNVIERPLVSVITSISIDHTAFLGTTIPEIAAHKAGIIKPGRPVAYDDSNEEASRVIQAEAAACGSRCIPVSKVEFSCGESALEAEIFYRGTKRRFVVPFAAPYQAMNAALALEAVETAFSGAAADLAPIPYETAAAGLAKAVWPARMEEIAPGIFLDGAHNEDGIRAFLNAACLLKETRRPRRTCLVFAVSSDKDHARMLKEISGRLAPDICFLTAMESKRALSPEELYAEAAGVFLASTRLSCLSDVRAALRQLFSEKTEDDLAFIAGSLYLAGEVKMVTDQAGTGAMIEKGEDGL